MDRQTEEVPAEVSERAKQAGETRNRWSWVEPSVWNERMLTALETGVKGGKWFSLIDKVYNAENLEASFKKEKANRGAAGIDHQTIGMFEARRGENLGRISEELRLGKYKPQGIRRVEIPKPASKEKRPLGIPIVKDRVVQTALRNVIEPIFECDFAKHSYGFRPRRGCKDALRRVEALLKEGFGYVVEIDIRKYFEKIPHKALMEQIGLKLSDGRVLELIEACLAQGVLEEVREELPGEGTPQGSTVSPLLANIYLNPFDHIMEAKGYEMIRYADDAVVMCRNEEEAQNALREIKQWMETAGLQLHEQKTRIAKADTEGFDFLGYHFERNMKWPREKSFRKLQDSLRQKTRRTNGQELAKIIASVNRTTSGWFEYFKHSHRTTFSTLDGWTRMRLRAILRKRDGRKGTGRGWDHRRWPNSFFAGQGLISLVTAHALVCQSVTRRTTNWRAVCGKSACTVRRGERWGNQSFLPLSDEVSKRRRRQMRISVQGMGATRLTDRYSRFLNRRMRTRMSGGVGGEGQGFSCPPLSRLWGLALRHSQRSSEVKS